MDLFKLQSATQRAVDYAMTVRDRLAAFDADDDRVRRRAKWACRACHYLVGSVVAGQAFSERACEACREPIRWPNTAVPRLCEDCSKRFNACRRCCGDLEMVLRRSLEP